MDEADRTRLYELEQRVALLETKLTAMAQSMNVTFTVQPQPSDQLGGELLQLIASGQRIDAIKRLREATGLGLKEAKDQIDEMAARAGY
jgi:ribosomal protein L7/L12